MMVRVLYAAGVLAAVAAGGVVWLTTLRWYSVDPDVEALLTGPGAVEVFAEGGREQGGSADDQVPPLVAQAQALAAYLAPPPRPARMPNAVPKDPEVAKEFPVLTRQDEDRTISVQPAISSLKFSVRATSYYAAEPDKSMALIAEPGGKAGSERWVREGHMLGHFVVHEIRQGFVVFRQGQYLKEVAVDRPQETKGLVRDVRTAEPKVSVAAVDERPLLDSVVGPNDVKVLSGGQ